jgi:hypothetical protein
MRDGLLSCCPAVPLLWGVLRAWDCSAAVLPRHSSSESRALVDANAVLASEFSSSFLALKCFLGRSSTACVIANTDILHLALVSTSTGPLFFDFSSHCSHVWPVPEPAVTPISPGMSEIDQNGRNGPVSVPV